MALNRQGRPNQPATADGHAAAGGVTYLDPTQIAEYKPGTLPAPGDEWQHRIADVLDRQNLAGARQQLAQRWAVGCVALEITQRCNLDCTLCYLSENSEAIHDLPLDEVFRRIDLIHAHFGANTDVQITGGEPTLRDRHELIAIVQRVRSLRMRPTLMTNGLRATRSVLRQLAQAGLMDVAFHVDTTQKLKGFVTESDLNRLRRKFIERASGLGLSIMFNTTVHDGNFDAIPDVVRFFRAHAASVRTASFQLQAETGRGSQGARGASITLESVARQIEIGAGTALRFDASLIGHPACNRYAMCVEANGNLHDAFDDLALVARIQAATAQLVFDRSQPGRAAATFLRWLARNPRHVWPLGSAILHKAWRMRGDLLRSRGKVHSLSFVLHNFMDAKRLEPDRISACVFKVMTAEGPLSMCIHNAKRDTYILQPIRIHRRGEDRLWHPLSADVSAATSVVAL